MRKKGNGIMEIMPASAHPTNMRNRVRFILSRFIRKGNIMTRKRSNVMTVTIILFKARHRTIYTYYIKLMNAPSVYSYYIYLDG